MNEEGLKLLPESTHDWDEVKNSDTPEIFWDRVSNLRTKFGTGLFKPGDDAGTEDWGKFTTKAVELSGDRLMPRPDLEDDAQRNALYKTLGRPDDAKGYEFAVIEDAPELSDDRKVFLSEMAFKANLTKSQLKVMDETVRGADIVSMTAQKTAMHDATKELEQEWGLTFKDRKHQAEKVAKVFFTHLGDEPVLTAPEIKAFYSIAKQLGSSSQEFKDQGDQFNSGMSPSEASEKIAEIRGNKDHAYFNMQSPGHAAAKAKMSELYKIKNNIAPE